MNIELIKKFQNDLSKYEAKIFMDLMANHNIKPAQFSQIVLTEVKKNPKMQEAYQNNPMSLFASILHCAELGLMPSEMAGEFFFIPFRDRGGKLNIKPIIGYKGITALLYRNKAIKLITCESVHEGDDFEYELGLEPKLTHKPLDKIRTNATLTHIYAVAKLENGEKVFKVMSVDEIKGVLATMKEMNTIYFDDKKDPMMWMPKKTVIKQLAKLLPKDYLGNKALAVDDRMEGGGYVILDDKGNVVVEQENAINIRAKKTNVYGTLANIKENNVDLSQANVDTFMVDHMGENNQVDKTTAR
jgi:recombination protein RecT